MATTKIFDSYSDFLNREDKEENGVSPKFSEANSEWEKENEKNKGCWSCSDCYHCSDCSDWMNNQSIEVEIMVFPVIEEIHQKVLEAVTAVGCKLEMSDWHTCETTHCRAGWVVYLAGEAGNKLEDMTSTEFAAKQIYKASSPIRVSPNQFFAKNERAMEDIIRCAEEEKALQTK